MSPPRGPGRGAGKSPPFRCSPSSSPGPPQRRRGPFPGAVPLSRPRPPGARPAQHPSGLGPGGCSRGRDTLGTQPLSLQCRPHPQGRTPSSAGLELSSAKPSEGFGGGIEPGQRPGGGSQTVIERCRVGSALRETISVVTFLHVGGAAVPQVWLSECA